MDINPYEFTAPFDAYEFGNFALQNDCTLVLLSCCWVDSKVENPASGIDTIQYWAARLEPIIAHLNRPTNKEAECFFACSNRIGTENDTTFVGSSCVLSLKEPALLAHGTKTSCEIIITDLPYNFN